jgi:mercuric ion binding protein
MGFLFSALCAEDIFVEVKGVVCSFCAQGISETVKKRAEVETVSVDIETGDVTIVTKGGQTLDDKTVEKLIEDAGYEISSIRRSR